MQSLRHYAATGQHIKTNKIKTQHYPAAASAWGKNIKGPGILILFVVTLLHVHNNSKLNVFRLALQVVRMTLCLTSQGRQRSAVAFHMRHSISVES